MISFEKLRQKVSDVYEPISGKVKRDNIYFDRMGKKVDANL